MGFEESIKQIIAAEVAKLMTEIVRLREAIEDQNSRRYVMHTADVLKELGISSKHLIELKKKGKLKSYRMIGGGKQYFKRDEVFSFLNSGQDESGLGRKKK